MWYPNVSSNFKGSYGLKDTVFKYAYFFLLIKKKKKTCELRLNMTVTALDRQVI